METILDSLNKTNGILDFAKHGEAYIGIKLKDKKKDILKLMGSPLSSKGNKDFGYMEYGNGMRIGFDGDYIDEVAILFTECTNVLFPVNYGEGKKNSKISRRTKLTSLILMFNSHGIKWKSWEERNKEFFFMITEGAIIVSFDLSTGELYRFVYSFVSVGLSKSIKWD